MKLVVYENERENDLPQLISNQIEHQQPIDKNPSKRISYTRSDLKSDDTINIHSAHKTWKVNILNELETPGFLKANKNENPFLSLLEISYTEMARMTLPPDVTPPMYLIRNKDIPEDIEGILSIDIGDSIKRKKKNTNTWSLKYTASNYDYDFQPNSNQDKAFYYSLENIPDIMYTWSKASDSLEIDIASIASSLVTDYVYQEDDGHRGNKGFYAVPTADNKLRLSFYEIDHDLKFSGSIMSFFSPRPANWLYKEKDYAITREDITEFPNLKHSKNHFWVTSSRLQNMFAFANPANYFKPDNRLYSSHKDRKAWRSLAKNKDFIKEKYKQFLKCVLIPTSLVKEGQLHVLDPSFPKEAEVIRLNTQAEYERRMELQAVLYSTREFRDHFTNYGKQYAKTIYEELNHYAESIDANETFQNDYLDNQDACFRGINTVLPGDTPLHVAIRLGTYRFDKSAYLWNDFIHIKNQDGDTPLDLVARKVNTYEPHSEIRNPSLDPICVYKHLISFGAKETDITKEMVRPKLNGNKLKDYHFQSYYEEIPIGNYDDLKKVLTDIGNDNNMTLKFKKIITVRVLKCIDTLPEDDRNRLKDDLNDKNINYLSYISQLRSDRFIVRAIRGLYGNSSTKKEINHLIDNAPPVMQNNL